MSLLMALGPILVDFWLQLGPPNPPQIDKKSTKSESFFQSIFWLIFEWFSNRFVADLASKLEGRRAILYWKNTILLMIFAFWANLPTRGYMIAFLVNLPPNLRPKTPPNLSQNRSKSSSKINAKIDQILNTSFFDLCWILVDLGAPNLSPARGSSLHVRSPFWLLGPLGAKLAQSAPQDPQHDLQDLNLDPKWPPRPPTWTTKWPPRPSIWSLNCSPRRLTWYQNGP